MLLYNSKETPKKDKILLEYGLSAPVKLIGKEY